MSSGPLQPSFRLPFNIDGKATPEVVDAIRSHDNSLVDLNQAIASLKRQIDAKTITTSTTTSTSSGGGGSTPLPFPFPGLGAVRDETGSTSYTPLAVDNGILLILNDASPVAVSLDSAMVTPYFLFATNFGTGLVTFTPTSGTINGSATYTLSTGYLAIIVFDGVNWKSSAVLIIPQNTPATAHEFFTAYNSVTGAFTAAQPDYSDLTSPPQLPITIAPVAGEYLTGYDSTTGLFSASTTPGISVTITTAALTTLGTQGSQTFTDGRLTAQVQAT